MKEEKLKFSDRGRRSLAAMQGTALGGTAANR